VGVAAVFLIVRQPRRRKPIDELEATDAALRNRIVDLEDKFESYTKREAVRSMRARREGSPDQQALPLNPIQDRAARLAELRTRLANKRAQGG
jgi:hypothetical protein